MFHYKQLHVQLRNGLKRNNFLFLWLTQQLNLKEKMMDALMSNRVEFVKLLLQKGVSMDEFLTNSRLRTLYAEAAKVSAKRNQFTIIIIIIIIITMHAYDRNNTAGN